MSPPSWWRMKGYLKFFLRIFGVRRKGASYTSSCSPSSWRPLFSRDSFWGYICWIGTMTTFRSFSLDVVDSSLDFSGPLHLLKQHLFQGPEGQGAIRSGWPEPYQGHITIGRFNKRENLIEAAIRFSCFVQNWLHSTGFHSNCEILNLEQQYNNFPIQVVVQPWTLWNHPNDYYQTTSVVP